MSEPLDRESLYIIARAPRAGFAKTRLGATIGHGRAVYLYRAFLKDLAARFSGPRFRLGWYITPPDGWPEISSLVGDSGHVVFQGKGDLTDRQRDFFRLAGNRGESPVVLMAADSPHLGTEVVEEAFRRLRTGDDIVVGPTYDGGYYLIGMSHPHDVLDGPMSTGSELDGLRGRAELAGLSVGLLEATFDVDLEEDLRWLIPHATSRGDLPATRAALESLGFLEQAKPEDADHVEKERFTPP
ncbi:TIGR04282 family arsenosugar biosynthesis glycosyltransferase [Rubrobacter indicoceani]|uniref:TIGR04282 family arsenosugar biosynthesis glycosyltransferase n=1 Tax=Rubrobacter indicoceani TaxID=2051957 RepID=UPI0013C40B9B|nr:TIGR04282 family arsenosugar biosynthesis glycosyltransferase [Rubrobacter indicoceani]